MRTPDAGDLTPLPRFRTMSEEQIVLSLLNSSGIPAVLSGGRYPRTGKRVLVPRDQYEDAIRLIADAHAGDADGGEDSLGQTDPGPMANAVGRILAIGAVIAAALVAAGVVYDAIRR